MSRKAAPKPSTTAKGGKRAGAGRPSMGRTLQLPKIQPQAHRSYLQPLQEALQRVQGRKSVTMAETIEIAALIAWDAVSSPTDGAAILKPEVLQGMRSAAWLRHATTQLTGPAEG